MFPYTFPFVFPSNPPPSGIVLKRGALADQFARGIKFGNVPEGRPEFISYPGSGRVAHVNTVESMLWRPADIRADGRYSGVIKFRFRDYRRSRIPAKIRG